jgi:hypothetical protein
LADGGVRELSKRPPETLLLGASASQEVKCFSRPAQHCYYSIAESHPGPSSPSELKAMVSSMPMMLEREIKNNFEGMEIAGE